MEMLPVGHCLEPNLSNPQVNCSQIVDSVATYGSGRLVPVIHFSFFINTCSFKSEKKEEISVCTVTFLDLLFFVSAPFKYISTEISRYLTL